MTTTTASGNVPGEASTSTVVALLLFDGCDVMDVVGPYEVLLTANRLARRDGAAPPFEVRTVSVDGGSVTGYGGLGLTPSHGAAGRTRDVDVLVVPGLVDVEAGLGDTALLEAIRVATDRVPLAASVCTGSFLLDEVGVTDGHDVTTHWEDVPALRERRRAAGRGGEVRAGVRWVDEGDVVTAGGITAGIDVTLHIVDRVAGRDLAVATARQMDHRWDETA